MALTLKEFVDRMKSAEVAGKQTVTFRLEQLKEVVAFIDKILLARIRGGQNRYKNSVLKMDAESIRRREAVRRSRLRKNNNMLQ